TCRTSSGSSPLSLLQSMMFVSSRMLPTTPPTQKTITLTAFSNESLSEEQMLDSASNEIRRLNRLHLKVKCPPFPKNGSSVQYSPKSPARRLFVSSRSSPAPSPLSLSFSIDALKNSLRPNKRRSAQRSHPDAIEVEIRTRAADSRECLVQLRTGAINDCKGCSCRC
ncbi:hypothetical protein F4604DRAFT_1817194, partial [Suillus subluteus]